MLSDQKLMAERMLADWPQERGNPVLVHNPNGKVIGLAIEEVTDAGTIYTILVKASDYQ